MKKIFSIFFIIGYLFLPQFSQAQTVGLGSYEVLSSDKNDYLKNLVQEALQTALSDSSKYRVQTLELSEKQIKTENLSKLLKQQKVDLFLVGSVLKSGTPVQINSRLYRLSKSGSEVISVSDTAENADQLLKVIKLHAQKISSQLNLSPSQKSQMPIEVQSNPVLPPPADSKLEKPKKKNGVIQMAPLTVKPWAAENTDYQWMSERLPYEARSLAASNWLGDNRPELILMSLHDLYLYEWNGPTLKLLGSYQSKSNDNFVKVYSYDLDQDGRSEVLVSNIRNAQASSFIFKVSEQGNLELMQDKIPYLLKVAVFEGNPQLIGESFYGSEKNRHQLFVLNYQDGKLKKGKKLNLPADIGLYGWTILENENQKSLAALSSLSILKLYKMNSQNDYEKVASSADQFGQSANIIELPIKNVFNQEEAAYSSFAIDPMGISYKDAKAEVLLSKNETYLNNALGTKPLFKSSSLVKLKESESGLREEWNSKKVDGALVDFIPIFSEKGRQVLALFWLRDKGLGASFKAYPSVLALYEVE